MSIIIGLTGPTGAGKSSLLGVAESYGYKVVDCDKTARRATEKGSLGLKALTEVFGCDILCEDGALNRRALAKRAFSSPEKTELLNKTLLPFIARLVLAESEGYDRVLWDAPTLFESGLDKKCDVTVGVLAHREIRMQRIIKRDNMSESEALIRLNAGKADEYYEKRADYIIYNNGETLAFENKFADILNNLKER